MGAFAGDERGSAAAREDVDAVVEDGELGSDFFRFGVDLAEEEFLGDDEGFVRGPAGGIGLTHDDFGSDVFEGQAGDFIGGEGAAVEADVLETAFAERIGIVAAA